ncbi:MAG TPA: metal-dependent phosphohydrolase [Clostridiales bacterium]|nr:MAG: hypothetical protein A2Y22_06380 [Clostridiales bacterium GWD2_32_59]HAN09933.1 metal-dependent phosphohydrolase [Clostridiales bacterium]
MKNDIIQKIYILVEEECKSEHNIFGYDAWDYHILSVVKNSKIMAEKLNADKEIVEIAALLHDYAGIKNKDWYEEHHIYGANEADIILTELYYPREKIELVKKCIFSHRGSVVYDKLTNEEKCVTDADAMAHIDQVLSLLKLAYGLKGMGVNEGAKFVKAKLERSFNKMSKEAQEIMKEKYELAQKILK